MLILSTIFLITGNLVVVASQTGLVSSVDSSEYYERYFLGLGTFFAWLNVLSLISKIPAFGVVSNSIQLAIETVGKLVIGVFPLYFAFLFGAYCMYHERDRFDTLTKTNAALSAIMAGDEILDLVLDLFRNYGIIGYIFSLSFCVLFIISIHNVFIYTVNRSFVQFQEAYEKKMKKKTHQRMSNQFRQQSVVNPVENLHEEELIQLTEDTIVSMDHCDPRKEVITDGKQAKKTTQEIFSKIIPQLSDSHIISMNAKKDLIKGDIRHLKESLADLYQERIGRS